MFQCGRIFPRLLGSPISKPTSFARAYNFQVMSDSKQALRNEGGSKKRPQQGWRGSKRQKTGKAKPAKEGGNDEVLLFDVTALFARQQLNVYASSTDEGTGRNGRKEETADDYGGQLAGDDPESLPKQFDEIEVNILEISSTGDGLGVYPGSSQIYSVPFSLPGDVVKAKVIRHYPESHHSLADFVSVLQAGPLRDDSRVNCKYFSTCSGCQFQMLDYGEQLKHKRNIVERAYRNFSQLSPELIPIIGDTIGSPLQYGYRTKLTPHFDGPPGNLTRDQKRKGERLYFKDTPNIGFMRKGLKGTLDIEDCPIGTDAVRMGMKSERLRVAAELEKYKRGATLLLRESTLRVANEDEKAKETIRNTVKLTSEKYTDFKSCITDNNGTSTEYIDDFVFTNTAGAFFQNNNSILPVFTQYIRDHILPREAGGKEINYFIDAYSGSGLFTITLSSLFKSSIGIDVSEPSIKSAAENAKLNKLAAEQCKFIAADAPELFKSITFPNDETVVVLDPPRKGCDESFLKQLMKFGPRRVVYVSCNVHTQARDVGVLVRGLESVESARYEIESLRGFDFFPQSTHVESVAVLNRVDVASDISMHAAQSTTEASAATGLETKAFIATTTQEDEPVKQ